MKGPSLGSVLGAKAVRNGHEPGRASLLASRDLVERPAARQEPRPTEPRFMGSVTALDRPTSPQRGNFPSRAPQASVFAAALGLALVWAGCAAYNGTSMAKPVLHVPRLDDPVAVDGRLDEPLYQHAACVANLVIAGEPARSPAATSAWLFWTADRLVFAFDCDDATPTASPATLNEHDVDPQDRVELFLWSGRQGDEYYCLELAPAGAVHDYRACFYRRFDDTWQPAAWEHAVRARPGGYVVEAALSRQAIKAMGFELRAGERWRAGLFRADFDPAKPDRPDWITWVDARTPQPDFHVAGAFGWLVLGGPSTSSPR